MGNMLVPGLAVVVVVAMQWLLCVDVDHCERCHGTVMSSLYCLFNIIRSTLVCPDSENI